MKNQRHLNRVYILCLFLTLVLTLLLLAAITLHAAVFDRILVQVGNRVITQHELEMAIQEEKTRSLRTGQPMPPADQLRKILFKRLIDDALLSAKADALSITVDKTELDADIAQRRQQAGLDKAEFEEYVDKLGFKPSEFREFLEERLRRQKLLQAEVFSKISINDDELRAKYKLLGSTKEYEVRHLMRAIPQGATPADEQRVKENMDWIQKELDTGASFEALTRDYSEDPNVSTTGGILMLNPEQVLPEFGQALKNLPIGAYSPVIRTNFGYHLMRLLKIHNRPPTSFESLKKQLQQELYQEKVQQSTEAYLQSLENELPIKHHQKI